MNRTLALLATLGSVAVLGGALAFQHIGGLAPCDLCIDQRWPHAAAIAIGVILLATGQRWLAGLGALAALVTSGIGAYHAGVEQGWWEGPSTCTSSNPGTLTADQLFDQIMAAPLVRCDDIAWQFLGLSMAGWNALLSLILAVLWIAAARRG
ncbi:disulfide bond formation protein B [Pseudooceanicola aestuarii]|uniref:disulfide bond formation protein B n=1 Tax=Pseudooceanicola aestuarii TaxID=2697319 RepID=UPI0013D6A0BD|nr:disulfide bond formation protein B [Pseudooceanicola aestuarii]